VPYATGVTIPEMVTGLVDAVLELPSAATTGRLPETDADFAFPEEAVNEVAT